jgi:hypothetical protein
MMDGPFLRALVAAVEKNLFPLAQISRASTQVRKDQSERASGIILFYTLK